MIREGGREGKGQVKEMEGGSWACKGGEIESEEV